MPDRRSLLAAAGLLAAAPAYAQSPDPRQTERAMGSATAKLEAEIVRIIQEAGLSVLAEAVRVRPSSAGNYVSVTASFMCPSREKYDEVHAALRAHPEVRWTL